MDIVKEIANFRDDGSFWVEAQWDDDARQVLTFDESGAVLDVRDYDADETAEADERAAVTAQEANRLDLQAKAVAALQNNRDFLAKTSYTNADIVAQVKALTRQMNGVIRLAANALDGTD